MHPLSATFAIRHPGFVFEGPVLPQQTVGVLHPPQLQVQDFNWTNHSERNGTLAESLNALFGAFRGGRHISVQGLHDAEEEAESNALPQSLYHLIDRTQQEAILVGQDEEEQHIAARRNFTSLVIVDTGVRVAGDYLEPQSRSPATRLRWSFCSDSELSPPTFVGYFMGTFHSLTLSPSAAIQYEAWDGDM